MRKSDTVFVDGREVPIDGERNLLEVIRKAGIDIPTFCYHSELSVHGACRMCIVDVEGRGIVTSCSTLPEPGLRVRTATPEVRDIRKIAVELLLANHEQACPTCVKSTDCRLQSIARRFGVDKVRFKPTHRPLPVDDSNPSVVRDPNKCILCGDCVRMCHEVQGIGAIDFVGRGASCAVTPAFGHDLGRGECVFCGQCARVCPTGALVPKSEIKGVWDAIYDKKKTVVAQIAPAVRVALGEEFGMRPGKLVTGQIAAALRMLGFDKVYDTCFAADLTIMEEGAELMMRKAEGRLLMTSCCPGWVKFAEQYHPELLPALSTCRSPQQMFGSLAKETLPGELGVAREDIVVVSIMPCTAKKFEASRPEFARDGVRDVDFVLTTQELARMIDEAGIRFESLSPDSLDMPFGYKTGAGVIFGASGGVAEAALRFAVEKISGRRPDRIDFEEVRGEEGLREATVKAGETELRLAVVSGLAAAARLAERIKRGEVSYDFVEVMACPGGCIGGAGQPVCFDAGARRERAKALYDTDKTLHLHKSQDNPYVAKVYAETLGEPGGGTAHKLLHTKYRSRRRATEVEIGVRAAGDAPKVKVRVCVGTGCYLRGSLDLLRRLTSTVESTDLAGSVDVSATFCFENCDRGPTVQVGDEVMTGSQFDGVMAAVEKAVKTYAR